MAVSHGQAPEALSAPDDAGSALRVLDPLPPPVLLLTGAISVQFGAALAVTMFDEIGAAGAALDRVGLAALILLIAWRPRVRGRDPRTLRLVALFGLTLALMNFSFYEALDRIALGPAVTIEFMGPIALAALLSRTRLDYVWIALAAVGVVLLAAPWSSGGGLDAVGLVFVAIAAVCWAGYIVLAQRTGQLFRGGEGLALAMAIGTLVPLVPGLIGGGTALFAPATLATGFAVALLSSVVPYSLETEALRRMSARVFGVLMSLEPALAALAGLLVLGQGLGLRDAFAIGLVVAASIGVTRGASPAPVDG